MEIKPCPFCGTEAFVNATVPYICRCPNNACHYHRYGWRALAEWNSRPLEDALCAEVAALKEQLARAWDMNKRCVKTATEKADAAENMRRHAASLKEQLAMAEARLAELEGR